MNEPPLRDPSRGSGPSEELDRLLARDADSTAAWEARAFDESVGDRSRSLVLFGAGGLGRKTLAGLRQEGIEPLAFADNNPAAWGKSVDGLTVLSPQEAAARFGESASFVVTIWRAGGKHRFAQFREQLHHLGCQSIAHAGGLFWKYPQTFLPFYALDLPHFVLRDAAAVRDGMRLWADEASQREYLDQVRWRLLLDFDGLASPVPGEQYFPDGLFSWRQDEVFIDCGAYDGDTVAAIVSREGSRFGRILAMEPDPANFAKLRQYVESLPPAIGSKITVSDLAAGSRRETVRFEATGNASATIGSAAATAAHGTTAAAAIEVQCAPLDEALDGLKPTFIKMDIEGAEPDALAGARRVITEHRPILAVCVYHRQDHLWRVPLWIAQATERYRFFLRPHNEEAWDLVCYAVPEERAERGG